MGAQRRPCGPPRSRSADGAKENSASERQCLSKLMRDEGSGAAAKVIDSRAKLAAALSNALIDEVINIHRPVPYRLGLAGDGVSSTTIVPMRRHPEALPDAEKAEIPLAKLANYALDPNHPTGGHKARRIKAALGFEAADAGRVAEMVRSAVSAYPAVAGASNAWGQVFSVDMPLTGSGGTAIVRTAWIIESGQHVPRLTSFYVRES